MGSESRAMAHDRPPDAPGLVCAVNQSQNKERKFKWLVFKEWTSRLFVAWRSR
jgi:hypothetical protein